jgi:hypothetical protein
MNQRIQELLQQATEDILGVPVVNHKKFAELIVRECIDTVSDCSVEYCTRPQIVSEIKEHFGVEE